MPPEEASHYVSGASADKTELLDVVFVIIIAGVGVGLERTEIRVDGSASVSGGLLFPPFTQCAGF
jgi:hypothetical protein